MQPLGIINKRILIATSVGISIVANASLFAQETHKPRFARSFAPSWVDRKNPDVAFMKWSNSTYLDDTSASIPQLKQPTLNQILFSNDVSKKWVQAYEDRTKAYDDLRIKEKMALTDDIEYRRYHADVEKITVDSLMDLASFHFTEGVKKAEKSSEVVRTFNKVQTTVQAASKAQREVSLWETTTIKTRWNLLNHVGEASLASPIINFAFRVDWGLDSSVGAEVRASNPGLLGRFTVGAERYVFEMGRPVPIIQADAAVVFKGTSKALNGVLVKGFPTSARSTLTCKYEDVNTVDMVDFGINQIERVVSFEFRYSFE